MKKLTFLVLIALLFAGIFIFRNEIKEVFSGNRSKNSTEVKLLIEKNPNAESIAALLFEKKIVSSKEEVLRYYSEKNHPKLSGGKYIIKPSEKINLLLDGFIDDGTGKGNAELKVKVLFNNYRTINDMASTVSTCIQADSASIVNFLSSSGFLDSLHFKIEELPALFVPKTYEMQYDSDAADFVEVILKEYNEFWTEERLQKIKLLGLKSSAELVTLASIVYAEQGLDNGEWAKIAGLYLNRMRQGIHLQSDPTAKYCFGEDAVNITRVYEKHLKKDCPYNTYLYPGLPPGPISFVPYDLVNAILDAPKVDYIYMCAKPGGKEHAFTNNKDVHDQNSAAFHKWMDELEKSN